MPKRAAPKHAVTHEPTAPRSRRVRAKAEAEPQGTRERILDAGEQAFAAHGLRGARVQEIVARAGVNERMLYHYFGDKDGLYLAVLERFVRGVANETEAILAATEGGPPIERLRTMLTGYFGSLMNAPNIVRVFLHEALAGWPSRVKIEKMREDTDARVAPMVFQLFADAARTGAFREGLDPRLALVVAGAACIFLPVALPRVQRIFEEKDLREPKELAALREGLVDVILNGVVARRRPPIRPAPVRRRSRRAR